jgi:hypothetical protein
MSNTERTIAPATLPVIKITAPRRSAAPFANLPDGAPVGPTFQSHIRWRTAKTILPIMVSLKTADGDLNCLWCGSLRDPIAVHDRLKSSESVSAFQPFQFFLNKLPIQFRSASFPSEVLFQSGLYG